MKNIINISLIFALYSITSNAFSQICDVDMDADVDRLDIRIIFDDRGQSVSPPDDPRDSNGDGKIDLLDARLCVLSCSLPSCAETSTNQAPVANAGPNQQVLVGDLVVLDGAASFDPDGQAITYRWFIQESPEASNAILEIDNTEIVTFEADAEGLYLISLVVNDGSLDSSISLVSVQVELPRMDPDPNHYFSGRASSATGWQPWVTDGTPEGTRQVALLNPFGSALSPSQAFFSLNRETYFAAIDGISAGRNFWKTAGIEENTVKVTDLGGLGISSSLSLLCEAADTIVFNAFDQQLGFTRSFSLNVAGIVNPIDDTRTVNCRNSANFDDGSEHGKLLFARLSSNLPSETLHSTDGVGIQELSINGNFVEGGSRITNVDGKLFYFTRTPLGYSLWAANADGSNRIELKTFINIDSTMRAGADTRNQLAVLNGKLYFNADDGLSGYSLWKSDGSVEGTELVKDFDNSPAHTEVDKILSVNGKLIFRVLQGDFELWVSDGTSQGTEKISDIAPTDLLDGGFFEYNQASANQLYFYAADGNDGTGLELWSSDGTSEGTSIVKDINPNGSSNPVNLVSLGDYIIFGAAASFSQGVEIWRSDGTAEGTFLLKDVCPEIGCDGFIPMSTE